MTDGTAPVRVLVVEDSPTQLELLRSELEDAGYDVTTAPNGEKGLEVFDPRRFDLVISDIVMPGQIDGYALCRRIKAGAGRMTPVVLLTSLADPLDIINGLECGADNFLTKPYQIDHLLGRLSQLLATRDARAAGRLRVGVDVVFLGRKFRISADREQILDLLITTFEDAVLQNKELRRRERELETARAELAKHAGSTEARITSILDLAEDAIISADASGSIIVFNRGAEKMFGYTADGAMGRPLASLLPVGIGNLIGDDETPAHDRPRAGSMAGRSEVNARRIDGNAFPAEVSISELEYDGTTIVTAIVRDITERKKLEAQYRQAQKMEAVGRLAGGIAHDFNNLLTAIIGYSQLLLLDLPTEDRRRQDVVEIRSAADRAAGLTRQLLAFSRQQVLEPRVIELNGIVEGIDNMLRRILGDDVVLRVVLAEDRGRILADPGQIEQVIMNLAINARDAMPSGGRLTIETANVILGPADIREQGGTRPGAHVMMAVSDTGHGMDAETRSKIFEPFFTTKPVGKGTGLGLATVYGIVKQSGGTIWVYSEPGQGATFKVYLPRVDAPAHTRVDSPAIPAGLLDGGETVLVVEDNPGVRRLICKLLQEHGYVVLEAGEPAEALTIAERPDLHLDLLIADVVMPGMSGPELARLLSASRPDLAVLCTSGYTEEAVGRHGAFESGHEFLQKPFTPEALLRKVRTILDASRA